MVRRHGTLAAIVLALLATLAACGGDDDGAPFEGLVGPVWQWQGTLYSDDSQATPQDPSRYTITFADNGTAGIQADCNSAVGEYETSEDGSLSIVLGPATLAACAEDSLSSRFLVDLEGAAIYFFDDSGRLKIDIKFSTGTMTFSAA